MAKQNKTSHLACTPMEVKPDDCRDPQFHLDITKKNEDAGRKTKAVKYKY